MPITPCLLAVYADWCGCGRNELVEAMLTIAPPVSLGEELADLILHAQEDRLQVDGDDAIEHLLLHVGQTNALELDRRTVHGTVERPEGIDSAVHELFDRGAAGDVGGDERRLTAGFGHQADCLISTVDGDVRNHHLGAGAGEGNGDRPSHPARSAGHERHLAVELPVAHHTPRFFSASTTRVRDRGGLRQPVTVR